MTKPYSALTVMAALLPLFLTVPTNAESVGLGISDLNINVVVVVGETKEFEVARLYNTGDLDLNITSAWIPEYVSSDILIQVVPNPLCLAPGKSELVYLEVSGSQPCNLSGYVDFDCDVALPKNYTSNPSVPGGRAHAHFKIIEKLPTSNVTTITVIGILLLTMTSAAAVVFWYHKRKPTRHLSKM